AMSVRLEMPITSTNCRRLLLFYAKDASVLGLRRVDTRSDQNGAVWNKIFESQPNGPTPELSAAAIYKGCGVEGNSVLSLTFYLS
ncbi:MAG: hypothetical protein AB7E52_00675, partial [Bdellovibrionales bacterium]